MKKIFGFLISVIAIYIGYSYTISHNNEINLWVKDVFGKNGKTLANPVFLPTYVYGIETSKFEVVEGIIRKHQSLSTILSKYNVDNHTINQLVTKGKQVYDFRRMAIGKPYTIFYTNDSILKCHYMIYEPNSLEYIVVDLNKGVRVYKQKRPSEIIKKTASGIIDGSLYTFLEQQKVNPILAIKLSEVFDWQVNFYKLHKGDKFKVIYDDLVVEGKSVGIKKIHAAYFEHRNKKYYAFNFKKAGNDYYDEKGQTLKKAFLRTPLKYSRISSRYTLKRYHPVLKRNKPHLGTDYAAPKGTPIRSVGDGVIIAASYSRYNGNFVKIKHDNIYSTQYLHMSRRAKQIRKGRKVKQGQIIGYVGSTGLATGPHLCYRFWKNGKQVDPYKEEIASSHPIESNYRKEFNLLKNHLKEKLDKTTYKDPPKNILVYKYSPAFDLLLN